jgi:putative tryptophan/tyrosine transport system substrate-binding protein
MQLDRFKRREFITLVGGAAAAWPLAARAQQPAMPVIGFLSSAMPEAYASRLAAFRQGLNETGFVEDRDVAVEYRWAGGNFDLLPVLAADLVRHKVAVISLGGTPAARAAKAATATIPVVFTVGGDPVQLGLVAALNRPGGNVTGVTTLESTLGPKQLQLLQELVPTATAVALLVNSANRTLAEMISRDMRAAAAAVGVQLVIMSASTERDFATVFETLVQRRVGALVISADVFFNTQSKVLATLATQNRLPAISQFSEFAAAGGLMSYGTLVVDMWRQVGVYTGRILKGENPADLPVMQPTKFELVINMKTAKALGLTIPPGVLAIADEVIE